MRKLVPIIYKYVYLIQNDDYYMHNSLKIISKLGLLLISFCSLGQENLVLNGDFEEYWQCPDDATQIERCKYVYNPCSLLTSTSDYFNACYTSGSGGAPVGVPETFNSFQYAKSGNGFVGFGCFDAPNFQYREYVELSLSTPTECGKKYLIEGYFNLDNLYRFTLKNIGFLFSEERISSNEYLYLNHKPQFIDSLSLINDTSNWIKISFEFTSDKEYSYLTIGHFSQDSTTNYVEVNSNAVLQDFATYFYLEDFSVTNIGVVEPEFPNIFTPNDDGINDFWTLPFLCDESAKKVYVLNRWGNLVYESNLENFQWDGKNQKGFECDDGIYYYRIYNNETIKSGAIQLIR